MNPVSSAFTTSTRAGFHTTRWSLVSKAGGDAFQEVNEALNELCQAYWRPIYAEVRRRGHAMADAQDLIFARLLLRQSFGRADQQRGRFRTYLLAALDHVLADHWREQNALKRGAGAVVFSLDAAEGETWYQELTLDRADPAEQFDQRWALILMDRALLCLREDYENSGRTMLFAYLKPFLASDAGADGYAQSAEQSGMTENTFRVAVHRFRKRFRECVREQVETTVADTSETDAEMKHLFGV